MVYLSVLQNNLTINTINMKGSTLHVNNRIQRSILEAKISLHKQRGTAIFQLKQKSTHQNRRLGPGNKKMYPIIKPRRQMATSRLPLKEIITYRIKL